MALGGHNNLYVTIFGVLGNIVSICVYLAPLPTFVQIYRKKSTLGYRSLPYVVAVFSAMLWMYYALITKDARLLITVNSVGCVIETLYIIAYIKYGTRETRKNAIKEIVSLNVCFFGFILLLTWFEFHDELRVTIVGWVCVAISGCVFLAPMSIVLQVYRTKSVEFMPFSLSFFLTLSAVMWFFYGLFKRDVVVAIPNVVGFFLGIIQMSFYACYRNTPKLVIDEEKLPEHIINMVMLGGPEVHPVDPNTCERENGNNKESDEKDCIEEKSVVPPTEVFPQVHHGPSPPVLVVCAA